MVRDRNVTSVPVTLASSSTAMVAWLSIAEKAPVKAMPTDCAVAVVVDNVTASDVAFTSPEVASNALVPERVTFDFEVVTETETSAGNRLAKFAQPSLDRSVFISDRPATVRSSPAVTDALSIVMVAMASLASN